LEIVADQTEEMKGEAIFRFLKAINKLTLRRRLQRRGLIAAGMIANTIRYSKPPYAPES